MLPDSLACALADSVRFHDVSRTAWMKAAASERPGESGDTVSGTKVEAGAWPRAESSDCRPARPHASIARRHADPACGALTGLGSLRARAGFSASGTPSEHSARTDLGSLPGGAGGAGVTQQTYGASTYLSRVAVASLRGIRCLPVMLGPWRGATGRTISIQSRLVGRTPARGYWPSVKMPPLSIIVARGSASSSISSSQNANVRHLRNGPGPSLAGPRLVGRISEAALRTFWPFAADAPSPTSLTRCAVGRAGRRHLLQMRCFDAFQREQTFKAAIAITLGRFRQTAHAVGSVAFCPSPVWSSAIIVAPSGKGA